MYQLEYLPAAQRDMVEIVKYISYELENPSTAKKLADDMISSAEGLTLFPYTNPIHRAIKPLQHEYRKLIIKNYIMFYYIDEPSKKVTISRVIYARRDYDTLL